jgi:hypothetical protein
MTRTTSIGLNAIAWTQEIRRYPTIGVEGLYLCVTGKIRHSSSLFLNDGRAIGGWEITLNIVPCKSPASEKIIGDLWSDHEQNFIHGSLYINDSEYLVVWEQVVNGNYVKCLIRIDVINVVDDGKPVWQDHRLIWQDNHVSIQNASISFERKLIPEEPKIEHIRKIPPIFTNQSWSIVLFLLASVAYGSIFEYSKDITTGESRIIAAILFVGGLLLWFSPKGAR